MNIGVTVYDGKDSDSAKIGAHLKRSIAMPQVPFVGMTIVTEKDHWKVKEVRWYAFDQSFFLVLEGKFKESEIGGIGILTFSGWLQELSAYGWQCTEPFDIR